MPDVEEEFEHTPMVLIARDLKRALADVPDNTKLVFSTPESPGSDMEADELIACAAGMGEVWDAQASKQAGTAKMVQAFLVTLEFPPGVYSRCVWKDD